MVHFGKPCGLSGLSILLTIPVSFRCSQYVVEALPLQERISKDPSHLTLGVSEVLQNNKAASLVSIQKQNLLNKEQK